MFPLLKAGPDGSGPAFFVLALLILGLGSLNLTGTECQTIFIDKTLDRARHIVDNAYPLSLQTADL